MSGLHADRAATLGRIGSTLQTLIETLETLRRQIAATPERDRAPFVSRYAALHEKARLYRWYLEVQREAVGLTRHDVIDQQYRLPPTQPV